MEKVSHWRSVEENIFTCLMKQSYPLISFKIITWQSCFFKAVMIGIGLTKLYLIDCCLRSFYMVLDLKLVWIFYPIRFLFCTDKHFTDCICQFCLYWIKHFLCVLTIVLKYFFGELETSSDKKTHLNVTQKNDHVIYCKILSRQIVFFVVFTSVSYFFYSKYILTHLYMAYF